MLDNVDCGVNEWCRPQLHNAASCLWSIRYCTPKRDIGDPCTGFGGCEAERCKDGLTCEKGVCTAPKRERCTLNCGTVVREGWGGNDEGSNACNTCDCLEGGLLRCTRETCLDAPCPPKKKSCELQCGTVVYDGWAVVDEGSNDCNICTCTDGALACSKNECIGSKECPKPETCTLKCGTVVPVGWSGLDEGSNA